MSMMRETAYRQIQDAGEKLLQMGINTSHSGNISIRGDADIFITRTGSRLDRLVESDIIAVPLSEDVQGIASVELPMHRQIYLNTGAKAILHAHPPHTIVFSLVEDVIYPVDNEAFLFLGEIPVLKPKEVSGSAETGKLLADAFARGSHIAVIRGHGSFAAGENLEEGLHWTTTLERACQMAYLLRNLSPFRYREIIRSRQQDIRQRAKPRLSHSSHAKLSDRKPAPARREIQPKS